MGKIKEKIKKIEVSLKYLKDLESSSESEGALNTIPSKDNVEKYIMEVRKLEIKELSISDMKSAGGGARTWNHDAIVEALQDLYQENVEEEDGTVVLGIPLKEIAKEFYEGTLEDLRAMKNTGPDVARTILNDLQKAGFSKSSSAEGIEDATGYENGGELIKVELTPQ